MSSGQPGLHGEFLTLRPCRETLFLTKQNNKNLSNIFLKGYSFCHAECHSLLTLKLEMVEIVQLVPIKTIESRGRWSQALRSIETAHLSLWSTTPSYAGKEKGQNSGFQTEI